MKKYLYRDLYELEEKHWWHVAKRKTCILILKKYLRVKRPIILDIGCGTGKNLEEFSKIGNAFGVDSSAEAIKYCRERNLSNVSIGTAEKTRYNNSKFDVVAMLDVLEHTDDVKALKETFRILKTNGILLLTVPAYQWMWSRWDVVLHHKRRYTKNKVENLLKENGFSVVKSSYLYSFLLLPVFLIRVIKSSQNNDEYTSDFKEGPQFLGNVLGVLSDFERYLALYFGIPFGLSIIVLAKKKG